jgi:hypothetical protein
LCVGTRIGEGAGAARGAGAWELGWKEVSSRRSSGDTKQSEKLFLWKAHNDGDQYFLNPQKGDEIKKLVQLQFA